MRNLDSLTRGEKGERKDLSLFMKHLNLFNFRYLDSNHLTLLNSKTFNGLRNLKDL